MLFVHTGLRTYILGKIRQNKSFSLDIFPKLLLNSVSNAHRAAIIVFESRRTNKQLHDWTVGITYDGTNQSQSSKRSHTICCVSVSIRFSEFVQRLNFYNAARNDIFKANKETTFHRKEEFIAH